MPLSVKLWYPVAVLLPGLMYFAFLLPSETRQLMLDQRREEARHLAYIASNLFPGSTEYSVEAVQASLRNIEALKAEKSVQFWVLDETPMVLSHPVLERGTPAEDIADANGARIYHAIANHTAKTGSYHFTYLPEKHATPYAGHALKIAGMGMVVVALVPLDGLDAMFSNYMQYSLLFVAFLAGSAAFVAIAVGRQMSSSIYELCKISAQKSGYEALLASFNSGCSEIEELKQSIADNKKREAQIETLNTQHLLDQRETNEKLRKFEGETLELLDETGLLAEKVITEAGKSGASQAASLAQDIKEKLGAFAHRIRPDL